MNLKIVSDWIEKNRVAYFERDKQTFYLNRNSDGYFTSIPLGMSESTIMSDAEVEHMLFYIDPSCYRLITQPKKEPTIYDIIEYLKQSSHNVLYFKGGLEFDLAELRWIFDPNDFIAPACHGDPGLGYRKADDDHGDFFDITENFYLNGILKLPSRVFMDRNMKIPFDKSLKKPFFEKGDIVKAKGVLTEIRFDPIYLANGWGYPFSGSKDDIPMEEKEIKLVCKKSAREDRE